VQAGIGSSPEEQLEAGMSEDGRMLGNDSFISSLPVKVHSRCHLSLEELIERVSVMNGVSPESLRSPGRSRAAARVRALIAYHAVNLRIATLSTVARCFGRSVSAISQSLQHHRQVNPGLFAVSVDRITS
jgi:chromosomal replication initiation ATPase DnaA